MLKMSPNVGKHDINKIIDEKLYMFLLSVNKSICCEAETGRMKDSHTAYYNLPYQVYGIHNKDDVVQTNAQTSTSISAKQ